ncbi:hypothetical protein [Segetibacter koreensis]|nr:hypothetical protein [Segetibacter koreensis]
MIRRSGARRCMATFLLTFGVLHEQIGGWKAIAEVVIKVQFIRN